MAWIVRRSGVSAHTPAMAELLIPSPRMLSLADRLRALFMRGPDDIGLLRSHGEAQFWTRRLPHVALDAVPPEGARGVFVGHVRAVGATMDSPLSLAPCVAFRVTHWESDDRSGVAQAVPFDLDDGKGHRVRIDTEQSGLSLLVPDGAVVDANVYTEGPDALRAYVQRRRVEDPQWRGDSILGLRARRYIERRLSIGDPVAIIGAARWTSVERDDASTMVSSGYRDAARGLLLATAPDAMFLYVTEASDG